MEYGAQIKSVSDVKGDSIVKSIWSKVAITTSYHTCYHKWALVLPTKLHLSALVYILYTYIYTDYLIPENFGSQPPTSHQEEKSICVFKYLSISLP